MPHLESKTKLIMTVSVNKYINPFFLQRIAGQLVDCECKGTIKKATYKNM